MLRIGGREIPVGSPPVDVRVEARTALRILAKATARVELVLANLAQRRVNAESHAVHRPRTPGVWVGEVASPASARPPIAAAPGVIVGEEAYMPTRVDSPDEVIAAYELAWSRAEAAMRAVQERRDDPDVSFEDDNTLRLPAWRDW